MQRILVLRGGALGDFIVTLPALALLRGRWPGAHIELAGNATAAQLARNRGLVNTVHSQSEARWSRLYGDDGLPPEFARWLAGFDLVVSYWPDPDGRLRCHFPRRPDQVFLSAPAQPEVAPAAAHYCAALQSLGLKAGPLWYPLINHEAENVRRRGLLIHPGSGSPRKNWPRENWVELCARLEPPAGLILGEAELALWANFQPTGFTLLVNLPLEELCTQLSRCDLFMGHDSGVSHLAAACGAPCLLLFGPTDPRLWAPPQPGVRVLQAEGGLPAISVAQVERAIA
jgi:ADP-heptose:LPS heptosyltransferase